MKSALMLGVNPQADRQKEDFYATNPKALNLFLEAFKEKLNEPVWEPSCGQGHLAEELRKHGYDVLATDLVDRGYGTGGVNFFNVIADHPGDILTNPPFKCAENYVEKGMSVLEKGRKMFLFLKIQFLEGQKRNELFKKYPPKYVYCHSSRQLCAKDGKFEKYTSTTQFYAWYVWEKGYYGDTIMKWIN